VAASLPEARSTVERAALAMTAEPALSAALRDVAALLAELEGRLGVLGFDDAVPASPKAVEAELSALKRETEAAVETIMTAAEVMLTHSRQAGSDLDGVVRREAVAILEACGFQDIAGQRVSKVSGILRKLDAGLTDVARLGPFAAAAREETAEERRVRELILHGPAADAPELSQDDVDAMFS
jgi:chemotaxis protein CheZ